MERRRLVKAWLLVCLLVAGCSSATSADTVESERPPVDGCGDVTFTTRGQATDSQSVLQVVITNGDFGPCRVEGFPTVELIGDPEHFFGGSYVLPRQRGRATPVVLREGESALFPLTWLPDEAPDAWVPGYLRIILPGVRSPWVVRWSVGGIVRQDAATHPGSFVGPIRRSDASCEAGRLLDRRWDASQEEATSQYDAFMASQRAAWAALRDFGDTLVDPAVERAVQVVLGADQEISERPWTQEQQDALAELEQHLRRECGIDL